MANNNLIYLNHKDKNASLKVTLNAPMLSSYREGWQNICLECHSQPAHENPSYISACQKLAIFHSPKKPIANERRLDGLLQQKQIIDNDIMIVPAEVTSSGVWHDEIKATLIILEPTYISNLVPEAINPDRVELIPQFPRSDPLVVQIGLALKQELELGSFHGNFYIEALSNALGMHLIYKYGSKKLKIKEYSDGLSNQQLAPVLEYIHEHLAEEIKLVDLAAIVGMSQYYFSRFFKKSMGISPYQYVIQQRINKAKLLFQQTDLSIFEVAIQCGFSHSSHLARHFKRLEGVSPQVFRKK